VVAVSYTLTALLGYLLGSIPTGYLVGLARGVDVRAVGSGNIGATNVFRTLGKPAGIVVLLVDALKGFVACRVVVDLVWNFIFPAAQKDSSSREYLLLLAGLTAILGHNYTCWLKFKGGKGIATTAGVLSALMPLALLTILSVWIIIVALTRYVSLGSLAAAVVLPFSAWYFEGSPRMITLAILMAGLAIYKHRSNIQRLLKGTENRFGVKDPSVPPAS
jgi:glycerol-3-phosphate acyltransferase PlsY